MKTDAFVASHISPVYTTITIMCYHTFSTTDSIWWCLSAQCTHNMFYQGCKRSYLSCSSLLLIVEQIRSESFSSWFSVFWTAWLMVFSMVWQTPSIWFTHLLGYMRQTARKHVRFGLNMKNTLHISIKDGLESSMTNPEGILTDSLVDLAESEAALAQQKWSGGLEGCTNLPRTLRGCRS